MSLLIAVGDLDVDVANFTLVEFLFASSAPLLQNHVSESNEADRTANEQIERKSRVLWTIVQVFNSFFL